MPLGVLDYSLESCKEIDKKVEKLERYQVEQIIQLLNVYGCKVLAKENNGILWPVETPLHKFSMDVKINDKLYCPLVYIVDGLDSEYADNAVSLYFAIRFAPESIKK